MPHHRPGAASQLTVLTGASRGLGRALAVQLLTEGHHLLTLARQPDPRLAAHAASTGTTLQQWAADLSDPAPVAARLANWLAQQDASAWSHVTLINNAAHMPAIVPLRDAPLPDLAQALHVGLQAPLQLSAAFLAATRTWPGQRRVLNISSGLGRRPLAAQAAYCAVKAGLDHFTRCLALEEAELPHGARVCALAPGVIDTDMQTQLRQADPAAFAGRERFVQLHRQGQLSSASDAARQVLAFLARPDFGTEPVADVRQA